MKIRFSGLSGTPFNMDTVRQRLRKWAAAPTVVSLTFHDGNADQLTAAQIMNNYGLDGTFHSPSRFINNPNYLTVANLQGLAANGRGTLVTDDFAMYDSVGAPSL
jgi:hypothetical protein